MTNEERKALVERLRDGVLYGDARLHNPKGHDPLRMKAATQLEADGQRIAELEAAKDGVYYERNQVVAALTKCFPSGVAKTAIEGWSEDWHGCVYIDLPTGQVSWHFHDSQSHLFDNLPPYQGKWDGHNTPEKYQRLANLTRAALGDKTDD